MAEKKHTNIIVLVGPTASGKSELAVKIAKKFNGEIISADSRQVYKYLNIGSAKVPGKWQSRDKRQWISNKKIFIYKGVPHHCIDFVDPKKVFTVAEYKKCALKAIRDIANRNKIPILVGGTGFYIDAVIYNLFLPEVPPDERLRKKLERLPPARLFERLRKLDPRRAASIDRYNKRRLIRTLEIVIKTGRPIPPLQYAQYPSKTFFIGLKILPDKLKKRIEMRLDKRLRNGLIEEVINLRKKHRLSWKRLDELGLEYRYVSRYLRGLLSYQEMKNKINSESWHYAKRQMTWWNRNKNIIWLDPTTLTERRIYEMINTFLKKGK